MDKICLIPGSFDPITLGHLDIIDRAHKRFKKVIVGIGVNPSKQYLFSVSNRIKYIKSCVSELGNIEVVSYDGLTIEFATKHNVTHIVKGIRNHKDLIYEEEQTRFNKSKNPNIKTIYYYTRLRFRNISSTVARQELERGNDVSKILPKQVIELIKKEK